MADILLPPAKSPETETFRAPKPGATIQVIGAGLPRAGTNSFCAAISHLLDGPAYHCGIQAYTSTSEHHAKVWLRVLKLLTRRSPSPEDRKEALRLMRTELDGYVATADPPLSSLLPELLELYPDAKVICTYRSKESWAKTMEIPLKYANMHLMNFFFFWIRSLRWFGSMGISIGDLWLQRYGVTTKDYETAGQVWEAHMKMLKEVVPEERLFMVPYDAGWGPLCKVLGVPVPETEYPNLLNSKSYDATFGTWIAQGLGLWGVFVGVVAVGLGGLVWMVGGR